MGIIYKNKYQKFQNKGKIPSSGVNRKLDLYNFNSMLGDFKNTDYSGNWKETATNIEEERQQIPTKNLIAEEKITRNKANQNYGGKSTPVNGTTGSIKDASTLNPVKQYWAGARNNAFWSNPFVEMSPFGAVKYATDTGGNYYDTFNAINKGDTNTALSKGAEALIGTLLLKGGDAAIDAYMPSMRSKVSGILPKRLTGKSKTFTGGASPYKAADIDIDNIPINYTIPQTKAKQELDNFIAEYVGRINTPEGARRAKELGITKESLEGLRGDISTNYSFSNPSGRYNDARNAVEIDYHPTYVDPATGNFTPRGKAVMGHEAQHKSQLAGIPGNTPEERYQNLIDKGIGSSILDKEIGESFKIIPDLENKLIAETSPIKLLDDVKRLYSGGWRHANTMSDEHVDMHKVVTEILNDLDPFDPNLVNNLKKITDYSESYLNKYKPNRDIKLELNTPEYNEQNTLLGSSSNLGEPVGALDYYNTGSTGVEKSAFLAEVRERMLDEGAIKERYENITPDMIKRYYNDYVSSPKEKDLRWFNIMDPNHAPNYSNTAQWLNRMYGGIGLLGALSNRNNEGIMYKK